MQNKTSFFKKYLSDYKKLIENLDINKINSFLKLIKKVKKKNKVLIFGNGAGAAIASHVASDLTNSSKIKALSFDNSAQITCFSNDFRFENWITKTLDYYSEKGDVVILLSASGNSANMLNAAKYCKRKKIKFFSITGFDRYNKLNNLSSNFYWIKSKSYNHVESIQLLILLSIVDRLKKNN